MTINFRASSHGTSGEQYFILVQLLGIEQIYPSPYMLPFTYDPKLFNIEDCFFIFLKLY